MFAIGAPEGYNPSCKHYPTGPHGPLLWGVRPGIKNRQGNIAMPFGPDPALTQYRLRALSKKPTHYPF